MKREEQQLQMACVKYFKLQYPKVLIIHVPNEGKRTKAGNGILTGMGMLSGVSDLLIFKSKHDFEKDILYFGLSIELKSKTGTQSQSQKDFMLRIMQARWKYALINNFDDFKQVVDEYLSLEK